MRQYLLRVIEFSTYPHIPINVHISTMIIKGNNLNPPLKNAIERSYEGRITAKKDYEKADISSVGPSSERMTKG